MRALLRSVVGRKAGAASAAPARRPRCSRRRGDDGSMALELAIIAPALIGLLSLFIGLGRYNAATGNLESLAQDAARAATQTRSHADAEAVVNALIDQIKGVDTSGNDGTGSAAPGSDDYGLPSSCEKSLRLDSLTPDTFTQGAMVTVTVSCRVDYTDLIIPTSSDGSTLGSTTIRRSFTSPLDPFEGLDS